jgi:hypothetical protein
LLYLLVVKRLGIAVVMRSIVSFAGFNRLSLAVVMRSIVTFAGFNRLSLAVVMRSIVTLVQRRCCDEKYCDLFCLTRGSSCAAVVARSVAVFIGCQEAQHSRCHAKCSNIWWSSIGSA